MNKTTTKIAKILVTKIKKKNNTNKRLHAYRISSCVPLTRSYAFPHTHH